IFNQNLEHFNESQLVNHYDELGKDENRFYKFNMPLNFKYSEYLKLNPDLKNLSELQCYEHYTLYGLKEKRKY